jgi:aspartate/methionine/tyrosine aminotransferase
MQRLAGIPGFSIDRVAAAAGSDPDVLRLENLDTDLPPPAAAMQATREAIAQDDANSYLPFVGSVALRAAVAERLTRQTGFSYQPDHIVITCGGTEGMFDALLALTDPGDEVVLSDPTYAGMIYRVRLAGAVPKFVPLRRASVPQAVESGNSGNVWRLDLDALLSALSPRTRALFIMNPSMPSGGVLNREEWHRIAELCREQNLWLIYNAAMERILYDDREYVHPATLEGMAERTITVGSVSKEFRMIGWRIGWVAAQSSVINDIARVHIYNVVTPTGIAQAGAVAALQSPDDEFRNCLDEWRRRRNEMMNQLEGLPFIRPNGGWSLLLDVGSMGFDSSIASQLLLERGKLAATPMKHWGEKNADQFVRFVFSNEPPKRLQTIRERVMRALT